MKSTLLSACRALRHLRLPARDGVSLTFFSVIETTSSLLSLSRLSHYPRAGKYFCLLAFLEGEGKLFPNFTQSDRIWPGSGQLPPTHMHVTAEKKVLVHMYSFLLLSPPLPPFLPKQMYLDLYTCIHVFRRPRSSAHLLPPKKNRPVSFPSWALHSLTYLPRCENSDSGGSTFMRSHLFVHEPTLRRRQETPLQIKRTLSRRSPEPRQWQNSTLAF